VHPLPSGGGFGAHGGGGGGGGGLQGSGRRVTHLPSKQVAVSVCPAQVGPPKVQVLDPLHSSPEDGADAGQEPRFVGLGGGVVVGAGGFELISPSPHPSAVATTTNEGAKSLALDCLPLIPRQRSTPRASSGPGEPA
jgi:hypothetical protein